MAQLLRVIFPALLVISSSIAHAEILAGRAPKAAPFSSCSIQDPFSKGVITEVTASPSVKTVLVELSNGTFVTFTEEDFSTGLSLIGATGLSLEILGTLENGDKNSCKVLNFSTKI